MTTEPDHARGDSPPDGAHDADAARRAAGDNAAELARMGIDPRSLGLEPPAPAAPPPLPPPIAGTAGAPAPVLHRPLGAVNGPTGPAAAPNAADLGQFGRGEVGGKNLVEPLARLVATPPPPPPGAWRRAVRAVTRGLLDPGAAEAIEYERQLVARVRLRRSEPRVVAFVAGKGGVGTSTTAAGVALTLAILRTDTTALVSARAGAGSLGQRLLGRPAPPVPAVAGDGPTHEPLWAHGNLAIVDDAPWHTPAARDVLVALVDRLRGRHPFTVVDVGNDLGEPADGALGRTDQVVLVTSASRDSIAATRVALSRVHQVDPFRLATVVVAVTCANPRQYRQVAQRLHAALGLRAGRIVPVPFDPWLAAGDLLDPARLRPETREAYLRLAGLVVEPGRPDQWFSPAAGARQ